jgi:drug/metabolite transporter (DMT)-like permease
MLYTIDIPLLRLAQAEPATLIFARGLFIAIGISLLWLAMNRRGAKTPFISGLAGIAVAITSSLTSIMFLTAVNRTTAANLVFILALNPLLCAVLGWLFLKERVHKWTWTAIGFSLWGVAIIVWDGLAAGTYIGDLLALGAALGTAAALTIARSTGKNLVTSLAVGSLVSALFMSPWAEPSTLSPEAWMWVGLNGVIVVPLAGALIALAPRYLPAPEVAMFFLLDLVFTPIWMWLVFSELPSDRSLIGGIVLFLTVLAHSIWKYRSAKPIEYPSKSARARSARFHPLQF